MTNTDITLSESAAKQINRILHKKNSAGFLRVSVEGGGCSGFQYQFNIVGKKEKDDLIIKHELAQAVIDPLSAELIQGSVINYVEELIGSHFSIENPKAKNNCGCGTSFSL